MELTKLSFEPINYLILDEPTNHLDIDSREVLETAINEFPGTVLFISHDRYFINQVATDVLAVTKDQMTAYEGNYDDYLTALAKQAASQPATANPTTSAPSAKQQSYQQSKETQRARRKLQRQADQLEQTMTDLSEQQAAIEAEMSKPDIATDIAKLSDLQKELDQVSAKLAKTEEAWADAAEALESFDQEQA